jgi:4-hydroxy-2-oxoheptanedioate aldolase
MRENRVRQVWDAGGCALNCWLSSPSAVQAKLIASQGYDSVVVDLQHGYADYHDVAGIIAAVSATDAATLVRVPWNDPGWIMKALDAGAAGVICPMINSRADAEAFVKWCRYPPQGARSYGPTLAALHFGTDAGTYFERANQTVLAIAQIETVEALANLDEIMGVPGLDAAYVGPADLSISGGGPAKIDNVGEVSVARQLRILAAGRKHGVRVCFHSDGQDDIQLCLERGPDLLTVASDIAALVAGTATGLATARAMT